MHDIQTQLVGGYQDKRVKTMHVSLGTNDTTGFPPALIAGKLIEIVPGETLLAYENGNVGLPNVARPVFAHKLPPYFF